jgi:glutamate-1-semialdehyde 2,1-aminomutase
LDNVCYGISAPSAEAMGDRERPTVFQWTAGLPESSKDEFVILPWNDLELVRKTIEEQHEQIAAIITEPIMCNNGCIMPLEGFLRGLRNLCDQYNIALIFDEVITGFRVGLGGAQQYFNITPDLSIFAKAFASGYPISAIVGKREWMSLIEEAKVIHAGTMNSSNPTIAAALATLEVLEQEQPHERLFSLGRKLMEGLQQAGKETGHHLLIQGPGPMLHFGFTDLKEVKDYRDTFSYDKAKLGKFIAAMHDRGIRIIGRGLWYISTAHTEEDIDLALKTAKEVLGTL